MKQYAFSDDYTPHDILSCIEFQKQEPSIN